jgi:hypothetical protein
MQSPNFNPDLSFATLWMPRVIAIAGRYLGPRVLEAATLTHADFEEEGDIVTRRAHIGTRLRKPGYAERYFWEITITCQRDSGRPTQWHKITLGKGDYFFYGHATAAAPTDGAIHPWYLIDLHRFRLIEPGCRGERLGPNKNVKGEFAYFYAYDVRELYRRDPSVLIASNAKPRAA